MDQWSTERERGRRGLLLKGSGWLVGSFELACSGELPPWACDASLRYLFIRRRHYLLTVRKQASRVRLFIALRTSARRRAPHVLARQQRRADDLLETFNQIKITRPPTPDSV